MLLHRPLAFLAVTLVSLPLLSGCFGAHIRRIKSERDMLQARVIQLTQDLAAVDEEHEVEKARAMDLDRNLIAARQERDELATKLAEVTLKHEALLAGRPVVAPVAPTLAAVPDESPALRAQIEELNTKLAAAEIQVKMAQTAADEARTEVNELARLKDENMEAMRRAQGTLGDQSAALTDLRTEKAALESQLEEAKELLAATAQEKAALVSAADAESSRAAELAQGLTAAQEQLTAAQQKTSLLQTDAEKAAAERAKSAAPLAEAGQAASALAGALSAGKGWTTERAANGAAVAVTIPSDTLFKPGTTQLSEEGLRHLAQVVRTAGEHSWKRLAIEAHTDNIPVRNMPYPDNWELASARANEVLRWIAMQPGSDAARLSATSHGASQPAQANSTADGRRANRRVVLRYHFTD
jgi:chemotaxis protein MotB